MFNNIAAGYYIESVQRLMNVMKGLKKKLMIKLLKPETECTA